MRERCGAVWACVAATSHLRTRTAISTRTGPKFRVDVCARCNSAHDGARIVHCGLHRNAQKRPGSYHAAAMHAPSSKRGALLAGRQAQVSGKESGALRDWLALQTRVLTQTSVNKGVELGQSRAQTKQSTRSVKALSTCMSSRDGNRSRSTSGFGAPRDRSWPAGATPPGWFQNAQAPSTASPHPQGPALLMPHPLPRQKQQRRSAAPRHPSSWTAWPSAAQ